MKLFAYPNHGCWHISFEHRAPNFISFCLARPPKPPPASQIHEMWLVDVKVAILLADGTIATLLDVRSRKLAFTKEFRTFGQNTKSMAQTEFGRNSS